MSHTATDETAAVRLKFEQAGRIPAAGDNGAIASQRLERGATIAHGPEEWRISYTILEGHRFAIAPISKGERLLSWGLPFGLALRNIGPGDYICNEKILTALRERHVQFEMPATSNFSDYRLPYVLDEANFRPAAQVPRHVGDRLFQGFRRAGRRGVGTRNYIVLLGTTARSAGFVRLLASRFQNVRGEFANVDGVVAVDHTEGGSDGKHNNQELVLRTLAGFATNPNVGAVLCIDFGNERYNNQHLKETLVAGEYPLEGLIHEFFSITGHFEEALSRAEKIVRNWLPEVNRFTRTAESVAHLKLGLQCGGSDAFSGVSGNPLVGILSRETVAYGGSANLAETSELMGAESYVLSKVRDLATAKKFLETLGRFQEWAAWHGHTAEGNPSGGNNYRGLYNITIKSIGAALKKDPATRLDYVIDYGELMHEPGFYFMDSPGNDLESIAGQVAAGCNMILFSTGNGSITNFPFVPTIKIMTTTGRYELVRNEMDFNAGRYQDGEALEDLGAEAFDYMIEVASGEPSAGERAGHSQVQLWRDWFNTETGKIPEQVVLGIPIYDAKKTIRLPLPPELEADLVGPMRDERIGLILPTSLCSGQIASLIAQKLNTAIRAGAEFNLDRAVALPHTEGCGNSAGEGEEMFLRTMANYVVHPFVRKALLLEHGCEKTHNDAFRNQFGKLGLSDHNVGWASIQLDGGIESVTRRVMDWFAQSRERLEHDDPPAIGFFGRAVPPETSELFEGVWHAIISRGGTVLISENSALESKAHPVGFDPVTIRYGERFEKPGPHIMQCPTWDPTETLTGLAASGATLLVVYSDDMLFAGHPLVPMVQIAGRNRVAPELSADVDLVINPEAVREACYAIWELIANVRARRQMPRCWQIGNVGFQITRGYAGISL